MMTGFGEKWMGVILGSRSGSQVSEKVADVDFSRYSEHGSV